MTKYSTYLGLADKIKRRFESLIKQNEDLSEANHKLRLKNSQLQMLVDTKMRVEGDQYREFVRVKLEEFATETPRDNTGNDKQEIKD